MNEQFENSQTQAQNGVRRYSREEILYGTLTQETLAHIAANQPEHWQLLLEHPLCYPALRNWLIERLNEQQAQESRAAVDASVPGGAVNASSQPGGGFTAPYSAAARGEVAPGLRKNDKFEAFVKQYSPIISVCAGLVPLLMTIGICFSFLSSLGRSVAFPSPTMFVMICLLPLAVSVCSFFYVLERKFLLLIFALIAYGLIYLSYFFFSIPIVQYVYGSRLDAVLTDTTWSALRNSIPILLLVPFALTVVHLYYIMSEQRVERLRQGYGQQSASSQYAHYAAQSENSPVAGQGQAVSAQTAGEQAVAAPGSAQESFATGAATPGGAYGAQARQGDVAQPLTPQGSASEGSVQASGGAQQGLAPQDAAVQGAVPQSTLSQGAAPQTSLVEDSVQDTHTLAQGSQTELSSAENIETGAHPETPLEK